MSVRLLCLATVSAALLTACATSQENPNYKHSTKYKASTPYGSGSSSTTPVRYVQGSTATSSSTPVVYSGTTSTSNYHTVSDNSGYTRIDQECLNRETRNQLIGGALGGTAGAYAGKELIGGTKGALIGAAVGGTAGYGLGDKSVNCDPVAVPITRSSTITTQPYHTQAQFAPPVQPTPVYTAPTDQAYTGASGGTPGYDAVMGSLGNTAGTTYAPTQPQPTYTQPVPQQPVYLNPQPIYAQPPAGYAPPASMTPISNMPAQPVYSRAGYAAHNVTEGDTVYSLARTRCVSVEDIRRANNLDVNFSIKLGEFIQLPNSRC